MCSVVHNWWGCGNEHESIFFFSATQASPSEVQDIFQETSSNIFQLNSNSKEFAHMEKYWLKMILTILYRI